MGNVALYVSRERDGMRLGEVLRKKFRVRPFPPQRGKGKTAYPGLSRRDWLALQVRWDH